MRLFKLVVLSISIGLSGVAAAEEKSTQNPPAGVKKAEKCEHGVKKSVCTRCNPKLAAVFKKKGDWCGEHQRPESQCAVCNPELAKEGVKP